MKIGGPVYRIGVGGGAASSVDVQGNMSSCRLRPSFIKRTPRSLKLSSHYHVVFFTPIALSRLCKRRLWPRTKHSSLRCAGDEGNEDLDFNAVQRGDAEMEQKLNRVIRAAIENTGKAT